MQLSGRAGVTLFPNAVYAPHDIIVARVPAIEREPASGSGPVAGGREALQIGKKSGHNPTLVIKWWSERERR